jgi:hypothetical protein
MSSNTKCRHEFTMSDHQMQSAIRSIFNGFLFSKATVPRQGTCFGLLREVIRDIARALALCVAGRPRGARPPRHTGAMEFTFGHCGGGHWAAIRRVEEVR